VFVSWRTSVYLTLFHWPMGKNSGNRNGVCRYLQAILFFRAYLVTVLKALHRAFILFLFISG
jgi:hypothetical protein